MTMLPLKLTFLVNINRPLINENTQTETIWRFRFWNTSNHKDTRVFSHSDQKPNKEKAYNIEGLPAEEVLEQPACANSQSYAKAQPFFQLNLQAVFGSDTREEDPKKEQEGVIKAQAEHAESLFEAAIN